MYQNFICTISLRPLPVFMGDKIIYLRLCPSNFSSWGGGGHLSLLLPFSPSLCLCNLPFLLLSVPKRSLHYKKRLTSMLTSRVRIWRREFWAHVNANTGRTQTANYSQWLETCLRASGMRIRVGILMMHVARIWHREGLPGSKVYPHLKRKNINIFIFIFNMAVFIFLLKYQHCHITCHFNIFTNIHHGMYDHPIY